MWSHPLLMDALWSERNRKVLEAATQAQNLDQLNENPAAKPLSWPRLAVRMLALPALALGVRGSHAPGIPA